MNSYNIILFLGGDLTQVSTIKDLSNSGYKVIVVDQNPEAPGRRYAEYFFNHSCEDRYQIYQSIIATGMSLRNIFVYPSSERFLTTAAYLQITLKKPK